LQVSQLGDKLLPTKARTQQTNIRKATGGSYNHIVIQNDFLAGELSFH